MGSEKVRAQNKNFEICIQTNTMTNRTPNSKLMYTSQLREELSTGSSYEVMSVKYNLPFRTLLRHKSKQFGLHYRMTLKILVCKSAVFWTKNEGWWV